MASEDRGPRRAALARAAILAALALAIALFRLHTVDEPLERDLASYAVIGHELLAGRALYADLWDHKPPGVHLAYAAAELVCGRGARSIFALNVLAALVSLVGVYAATAALAGPSAGLLGAGFWTLVCGDLALQANQPNTEVFINAAVVWSAALLLAARPHGLGSARALGLGALLALGSLFKPTTIFVAAGLGLAHIACPPAACRRSRALVEVVLAAAVGAAAWLALGGWFALAGSFEAFRGAVFSYNGAYSGSLGWNLVRGLAPHRLLPAVLAGALPLVTLAVIGPLLPDFAGSRRARFLLVAWALGTLAGVAASGRFYPHYYQLWLPLLAAAAAAASARIAELAAGRRELALKLMGLAVALVLACLQFSSYRLDPSEWSRRKYGDIFVETVRAAARIDRLLRPGETFYEWGSEPGLYLSTQSSPPTGVFYALPLFEAPQPLRDELAARVIRDLDSQPPELVVANRGAPPPGAAPESDVSRLLAALDPRASPDHPVIRWLAERYVPLEVDAATERSPFIFLARRGGALEARQQRARRP